MNRCGKDLGVRLVLGEFNTNGRNYQKQTIDYFLKWQENKDFVGREGICLKEILYTTAEEWNSGSPRWNHMEYSDPLVLEFVYRVLYVFLEVDKSFIGSGKNWIKKLIGLTRWVN